MMHRRLGRFAALGLLALMAIPAMAQFDPRINNETGVSRANWPPDRPFDHIRMKLAIDIPDMNVRGFTAVQTLELAAVGKARDQIVLSAGDLTIHSVSKDGTDLGYRHEGGFLRIMLPEPAERSQPFEIQIRYSANFEGDQDGTGLTWTLGNPTAASQTNKVAQIHSQGQPEFTQNWMPCHDFPNEKVITEIKVTVDSAFQVISNGRIVSKLDGRDARTTWHWIQNRPHPYYLVSLVIGQFDRIELIEPNWREDRLWMPAYVPIGGAERGKVAFGNTPEMLDVFEKIFDEPYPWDKYSQVCVREFRWGGMENTGATTLYEDCWTVGEGEQDDLIVHELAHQWMGDLLTCKSWEHLWLNEGWATYSEALWFEHVSGPQGYFETVRSFLESQQENNQASAPGDPGMQSNRYNHPDDRFGIADDVYSKGAFVLHMLREHLGDEVFFKATRKYIDQYKYTVVETDNFRHVLEAVSGKNLEQFFEQWVERPGIPRLAIDLNYDESAGELVVSVEQTQRVDFENPAFVFDLPVEFQFSDGTSFIAPVRVDAISSQATIPVTERPSSINIDPRMQVLADWTLRTAMAAAEPQMEGDEG